MQSIRQEVHRILTSTIPNNILEHLPLVLWFLTYLLTNVYPHLFRVCALRFPLIVEVSEEQSSSSSSFLLTPGVRTSRVPASHSVSDTHASNLHGKLYNTFMYTLSLPTSWFNGLAALLKSYALNFLQLQSPLRVFSGVRDRGATHNDNKSHSLWRYLVAALFTSGASVFVHSNSVSLINTLIDYINANYNLINHEVSIMQQYVNRRRLLVEYLCAFVSNVMTNIIIQCVHTGVDVNGKFWRHIPSASEWQSTRQLGKGNLFSRLYANISLALYFIYVEIMMLRNPWMGWFFRIRAPNTNTNNNNNSNNINNTSHTNDVHVNNHSDSSTEHTSSTFTPEANTGRTETVNTRSSLQNKFTVSSTDLVYVSGNDVFNCALAGFRLAYRGEPSRLLSMLYLHLSNSTQLSVYHLLNRWYRGKYIWSPVTELPNVEANRFNIGHAATPATTTTTTATAISTNLGNNVLLPPYDSENGVRSYFTLRHTNDMFNSVGRGLRELLSTASELFTYGNAVTDINNVQNNRSSFEQSSSLPSEQTQRQSRNTQEDSTMVMSEPNLREYVLLCASSFSLINFNWWHFSSGILVGLTLRKLTEYWSYNREHYPELQKVVDWLFPSPVRIPELLLRNASASDGVCRIYSDDPEVISILHRTHNANSHSNNNDTSSVNNNNSNIRVEDNNIDNNGNSLPLSSSSASLPLQRYLLAPLQRLRIVMSSSYDTAEPNLPSPTQVNNDQTHHTNNHFVVAEIPISADCFCPISLTVMTDPVSTVDGFTYERSAIEQWFTQQQTSPMTNLRLSDLTLTTNMEVRTKVIAAAQQCSNILHELSRAL